MQATKKIMATKKSFRQDMAKCVGALASQLADKFPLTPLILTVLEQRLVGSFSKASTLVQIRGRLNERGRGERETDMVHPTVSTINADIAFRLLSLVLVGTLVLCLTGCDNRKSSGGAGGQGGQLTRRGLRDLADRFLGRRLESV